MSVKTSSTKTKKKPAPKKSPSKSSSIKIAAWEEDPANGNSSAGGKLLQLGVPNLNSTGLTTVIANPKTAPAPKIYNAGTKEFRYWSAASALSRASQFWSKLFPSLNWQGNRNKLPIGLDQGEDLNAYYDRAGLNFFHGTAGGVTVYSCESPDVVCHEHGHAVLDALKPQLWDAASIEVGAFHESFGDMSSILCALQIDTLRKDLLTETGGAIYKSSRLSRMAEQLGWAIRQDYPRAVDPDCLRNAVNSFFYRDPNTIPSSAPASSLSSEPHSFSRVFTAAFFEGLAGMFKARPKQDDANLLQTSRDMGIILATGAQAASVVPSFYSQVAANMVIAANAKFPNLGYGQALKSSFVRHGILTLAASNTFMRAENVKGFAAATEAPQQKELPRLNLSIAEYGLGINNIIVHAAAEPKRFDVTGASLSIGGVVPPTEDEAAKSFVEDLLRRGKLKVDTGKKNKNFSVAVTRVNEPETHDTHTHELVSEGNSYVLRRVRIDCGLHHH